MRQNQRESFSIFIQIYCEGLWVTWEQREKSTRLQKLSLGKGLPGKDESWRSWDRNRSEETGKEWTSTSLGRRPKPFLGSILWFALNAGDGTRSMWSQLSKEEPPSLEMKRRLMKWGTGVKNLTETLLLAGLPNRLVSTLFKQRFHELDSVNNWFSQQ